MVERLFVFTKSILGICIKNPAITTRAMRPIRQVLGGERVKYRDFTYSKIYNAEEWEVMYHINSKPRRIAKCNYEADAKEIVEALKMAEEI